MSTKGKWPRAHVMCLYTTPGDETLTPPLDVCTAATRQAPRSTQFLRTSARAHHLRIITRTGQNFKSKSANCGPGPTVQDSHNREANSTDIPTGDEHSHDSHVHSHIHREISIGEAVAFNYRPQHITKCMYIRISIMKSRSVRQLRSTIGLNT